MEYFKDKFGVLYQGDVLEELKKLPDESVNMCVTSPPYWGLRDYGTAEWVEGDINCDHIEQYRNPLKCAHSGNISNKKPNLEENQTASLDGLKQFKKICGKCGARRIDKQIGIEDTPEEYINKLVEIFREVRRILKKDGILWLNIGDSYWASGCEPSGNFGVNNNQRQNNSKGRYYIKSAYKAKDLVGIPWMLAFALRVDGWWLRQDIIWAKKNPMPESVKDRCTKSHEYIFLLSKSKKYYYDHEAIKEPAETDKKTFYAKLNKKEHKRTVLNDISKRIVSGFNNMKYSLLKNKRSVWHIATKPFKGAHFAVFPEELIKPCILAGCPEGGIVLDLFMGSGTTAVVSENLNRNWVGIELNKEYCELIKKRVEKNQDIFTEFNVSKG